MAAITSPFAVTVTLAVPPEVGEDMGEPMEFSYSGNCSSIVRQKLEFSGSGSKTLDTGTLPAGGAKVVLVRQLSGSSPITIQANGGSEPIPVGSNGMWLVVSPSPVAGIDAITLNYTSDAAVSLWILG